MGVVQGVLGDEYERLLLLLKKYEAEVAKLPRGAVSLKTKAGHEYAYLARREKGKVVFTYLGKASSPDVKKMQGAVTKRRDYEAKIKRVKQDIRELERALGRSRG
ncbi:MAG: hypothetical protein KBA61_03355 [Spirochaetes bacterium]|nr:hypothetical protein [Spirochaetota bacterium]